MSNNNNAAYVGIVGGGKGGLELLKIFDDSSLSKVVFIADLDTLAPGMVEAKMRNIKTETDIVKALRSGRLDFVFEATGSPKVAEIVSSNLPEGAEMVNSSSALLLFKILESRRNVANEVIKEVNTISSSIGSNVKEIGMFAKDIDFISRNLNLLSINARIEAARAQQHGKTFAVVANEVNRAADVVQAKAKEITMINNNILQISNSLNKSLNRLNN